jgi:glycosyltransferase involved in cell wall biosynthesis
VDVRLIVVGKVGNTSWERPARQAFDRCAKLKARTEFTGFVDEAQLQSHLASAHAFVLLREECRETRALFPTRLPEYLLSANPVICSTAGDLPCYLTHRQSAWLIPPGDAPGALADALCHLAAHEPERRAIGRGGRAAALEHMSYPVLGSRMAQFLETLGTNVPAAATGKAD